MGEEKQYMRKDVRLVEIKQRIHERLRDFKNIVLRQSLVTQAKQKAQNTENPFDFWILQAAKKLS